MDMNDPSTRVSEDCYIIIVYHYNKPKRIFSLGSHDAKYYDQIITKLNLQTRKQEYEHRLLQDQTTTARSKKKKRVLLVDDEPDITEFCSIALEYHGFKVDTFNDSIKALSNYKSDYYDLVILDIKMPKMDRFQLYNEIKEKDHKAKFCFLTASELYYEEFRNEQYRILDRNLFIQKPIANEELVREVNKLMISC